jgi:hypothetical protein
VADYIARLSDRGSLGEPIVWRTESIAEARELLANVGAWQSAPDTGDAILLSTSAYVEVFDDPKPEFAGDLTQLIDDGNGPRVIFDLGPRGGIRRVEL